MTFAAVVPVKRVIVGTGGMHFLGAIKKKKIQWGLRIETQMDVFVQYYSDNTCIC